MAMELIKIEGFQQNRVRLEDEINNEFRERPIVRIIYVLNVLVYGKQSQQKITKYHLATH